MNTASPASTASGPQGSTLAALARQPWKANDTQPWRAFHTSTGANSSSASAAAA